MSEKREGLCELCDREYRPWAAASPIWNATVRGGCINGDEEYGYLCASCFIGLAEERGVAERFQMRGLAKRELQTTTPSGRVWNDEAFAWVEGLNR